MSSFSAILILFDTRTILDLGQVALAYCATVALAMGIGTFSCFLMGVLPAWERVWGVITRPLFILSCVIFVFDDMPDGEGYPVVQSDRALRRIDAARLYPAYHGDHFGHLCHGGGDDHLRFPG